MHRDRIHRDRDLETAKLIAAPGGDAPAVRAVDGDCGASHWPAAHRVEDTASQRSAAVEADGAEVGRLAGQELCLGGFGSRALGRDQDQAAAEARIDLVELETAIAANDVGWGAELVQRNVEGRDRAAVGADKGRDEGDDRCRYAATAGDRGAGDQPVVAGGQTGDGEGAVAASARLAS